MERERKFSSPEGHVPSRAELALALESTSFSVDSGRVARQRDTYFDDVRGTLRAAGWALRWRRVGDRHVATAKAAGNVTGALHEREEIEAEAAPSPDDASSGTARPAWPPSVLRAVEPWVDPSALVPIALLETTRVAFTLRRGADATVELAFDEVRCRLPITRPRHRDDDDRGQERSMEPASDAGDRDAKVFAPEALFHEVEIEARAGATDADLLVIDEALTSILILTPSDVNKLERALALLEPFRPEPWAQAG